REDAGDEDVALLTVHEEHDASTINGADPRETTPQDSSIDGDFDHCWNDSFSRFLMSKEVNNWLKFQSLLPLNELPELYVRRSYKVIADQALLKVLSHAWDWKIGVYLPRDVEVDQGGETLWPYSGNQNFWSTDLWCLVDSVDPTSIAGFPIRKCSVLLASTPRRDCIGEFKKLVPTPDVLYMPLWSTEELAEIVPLCPNSTILWQHRFKCLGGLPRLVLQDIESDPENILMSACKLNSKTKIIQTLIHIRSEDPYREYAVAYASETAMKAIARTNVLCGYIFEPYTMDLLERGGKVQYRKLESGHQMRGADAKSKRDREITIPESLPFAPHTAQFIHELIGYLTKFSRPSIIARGEHGRRARDRCGRWRCAGQCELKMAYNYVATAQKPTSVTHSLTANFTGPNETNLLLAKCSHFEVHLLTPEGLLPQHDINMYGRISIFEVFRPANEPQDWLFIVTQRFQFCVLAYDAATQRVVTKAHGNIRDSIGRSSELVTSGNIDPEGRLIGMNLYEGYFKVIPIDQNKGNLKEAFNVRLDEQHVVDIKFLHGYNKPTICVLYEDTTKSARHVKTYHVLLKEKDLAEGPWSQANVEASASLLVPVPSPLNGVLIVSNQTVVYHNGNTFHAIPMQSTVIQVYGAVDKDGSRFLLADQYGTLSVVALQHNDREVVGAHLEVLGETSIASCLSYLDNGVVFVGSTFGDSQLIKLLPERDERGSYIEVLDTYTNIGPIVDFCVMDLDRQGQGQIVTCSGADKDGSLRIIRNGIGINEQATTELPGIKGMWSLRETFASEHDKYLVQSYVSEIRVLAIGDDDEMEEKEIPTLLNAKTLHCRNLAGNGWLQVTEHEMRVICSESFQLRSSWKPPAGSRITVAAASPTQVVVATSGGFLIYFEVQKLQLIEQCQTQMEFEIACVDLTPLPPNGNAKPKAASGSFDTDVNMAGGASHWETTALRTSICTVGLWTNFSVCVLQLPTLQVLSKEPLGNDLLPRSVLCSSFEGKDYLLVGLGDGSLINFHLDAQHGTLSERKRISLGSQPISLSMFRSKDMMHVFAACDRPTVIYSNNNKLLYSNVNTKEVNVMCPFDSEAIPECMALASEEDLTIGTVDDIQKLHIQTVHLNEWARRIAHDPQSHTLGVLTSKFSVDENGEEVEHAYVRLFDDQTFELLNSYRLDPFEAVGAIISTSFAGDSSNTTYFVVGTAYVHDEEWEPHQGRILVFSISGIHGERKLQLVTEREVKGSVFCLNAFNGKVLAGVNSKVQLYKWSESTESEKELISECGHHGHTIVVHMDSRGDFIIVGDLMKSVSLLSYKQLDGSIEEIAKDLNSNWMTAVGIIDTDTYIGSESDFNLFTVQRNSGAASDEERGRLETVGEYHVGEYINRFRFGSLVMQNQNQVGSSSSEMVDVGQPQLDVATKKSATSPDGQHQSMLFGSASGMIGVILPITKEQYQVLVRVQNALNRVIKGVGGFSHKEWRMFENRRSVAEARNFIYGDLVESFLDLSKSEMMKEKPGKEAVKLPPVASSPSPKKVALAVLIRTPKITDKMQGMFLGGAEGFGAKASSPVKPVAKEPKSVPSASPTSPNKKPTRPASKSDASRPLVSLPAMEDTTTATPAPGPNVDVIPTATVAAEEEQARAAQAAAELAEAAAKAKALAEAEEAERLRKERGNGMVKLIYEQYDELFPIVDGSTTQAAVDDVYCLSFVMPNCLVHLSKHPGPERLKHENDGVFDSLMPENPRGTFQDLEKDQTYYVVVEQEADQLRRDQEATKAKWEPAIKQNKLEKDDGRGFETCSCIYGNPCVDEYGCKDWHSRYAVATANGWKGF
ncbi:TPA: LOW QUALITY PROTEIN: hypothetical protein N0F65_013069, partial [Lagenidium giganteum]